MASRRQSLSEDRLVRTLPSHQQSMASGQNKRCGQRCFVSGSTWRQNGLSWSSRRVYRRGKPKSLTIFQQMAGTVPALSLRLAMLVRLIEDDECLLLPAPTCRDWKSPGDRSHARLRASRGQPMPEMIGVRISSQLFQWMLALPVKRIRVRLDANGSRR
jgi:hypothetical protein